MPEPATNLARAQLLELDAEHRDVKGGGRTVTVQFNPETLKVSFANQIQQPPGGGDQRGGGTRQFVGAGTTKLALQLWFDVTAPQPDGSSVTDVRKLTEQVAFFITPQPAPRGKEGQFVPPGVRFAWGSFQFDGMVDSLEESLEFFSPDGRPLRASVSLALSQQKISTFAFRPTSGAGGASLGAPRTPGTSPLTPTTQGATLQGLADAGAAGGDWQSIARANGIENPRRLEPGRLIDLNVSVSLPRLGG